MCLGIRPRRERFRPVNARRFPIEWTWSEGLAKALDDVRPREAEGYVFVGNNGRAHVSPTTIWGWVRKVGDVCGVDVIPRRLRATGASMVLEATGDIDAAAELLGHRDIAVTRLHYTVTSRRRLDAAISALDFGSHAGGDEA